MDDEQKQQFDLIEKLIEQNDGEPNWEEIGVAIAKSPEAARSFHRYHSRRMGKKDAYKSTIEISGDGSVVSDRIIAMSEEDAKSPMRVIELHGYDPDLWNLIRCRSNFWQMMKSHKTGGGTQNLYQSRIEMKPKDEGEITMRDIDAFFEDYKPSKLAPKAKRKKKEGQLLEIVLGDMHLDGDNNSNIEESLRNTIAGIKEIDAEISEIVLVPIGDIFHYDTYQKSTTGGTNIESGGMGHQKMFDLGLKLLLHSIDELKEVAPISVKFVPGNHDYTYSYMLLKSVEAHYRNDDNVTVDCGHHPRKAMLWGENLIVWAHGDVAKNRIADLPQVEFRELFGKAKCVELHAGHWHSQQTFEKGGVVVRNLPALARPSSWEIKEGFVGSLRGTMCYLWDKRPGYVANYQIRPESKGV